jgi:hypothetical protein
MRRVHGMHGMTARTVVPRSGAEPIASGHRGAATPSRVVQRVSGNTPGPARCRRGRSAQPAIGTVSLLQQASGGALGSLPGWTNPEARADREHTPPSQRRGSRQRLPDPRARWSSGAAMWLRTTTVSLA